MSTMRKHGIPAILTVLWLFASGPQIAAQTPAANHPVVTFTTLQSFDGKDGTESFSGMVQGANGNFYGTTYFGGAKNSGEVFEITPDGTLTILSSLCSKSHCTDGSYTYATPVQSTNGNFYGTTYTGGTSDLGTVFNLSPSGKLTTLHSFGGADGAEPLAGLALANGNLYGTTSTGGAQNDGTVFKITPGGTLTTLHSFSGADGEYPYASLALGADGNLYGTTLEGGTHGGYGTVFKVTPGGTFTVLYSFCSQSGCPGGQFPQTGLVQATNGLLYGTTIEGGAYGDGTIFSITTGGALSAVYNVCSQSGCPDGEYLYAPLIQATDGNLYGIMDVGGANNAGTVFKLTTSGTLTTLYNFCSQSGCTDGAYPAGSLLQATNGNLYGTTADGGVNNCVPSGCGTVFSISAGLSPFVETEPASGKVGAAVNILGTNLAGATSVTFNGTAATFTIKSQSEITTAVPSGATTGTVQVVTPGGTLTSNVPFRVTP